MSEEAIIKLVQIVAGTVTFLFVFWMFCKGIARAWQDG